MKRGIKYFTLLTSSLLLISCFEADTANIEKAINKVQDNQKIILQKIESLEKGQQALRKNLASNAKAAPKKDNKPKADPNKVYNVAVGNSVVKGNPNAKVTITEWMDFQWPYCAKSVSLVDDILKKYPNDVKVVIKNFPLSFHKQAMKAAKYVLAAKNQGKYSELYTVVMENYRQLKTNEDLPLQLAGELGLDVEQLKRDANSPAIANQIQIEIDELKNSGIPRMSVPKFLINGKEPQGRSLDAFSAVIDAELKKKK